MNKYAVRISYLEYGYVEIEAQNEESAKDKVNLAVEEGQVIWNDAEITDIQVKLI